MKWLKSLPKSIVVILLSTTLLCAATQTINTLPVSDSAFIANLQAFLKNENANRFHKKYAGFIFEGGIGATAAGLSHTIYAVTGFPNGYYTYKASTSHTYTNTTRTFVYLDYDSVRTITIAGATVTRSTYLVFAEMTAGSSQPVTPAGCTSLMQVDVSGGAITTVTDLRPGGRIDIECYTNFATALTSAPAKTTLVISTPTVVSANSTITQGLEIDYGGSLIHSTYTIAINGPFSAGLYKIFDGTGAVSFPSRYVNNIYPEWWGAVADAVVGGTYPNYTLTSGTDSGVALNKALAACKRSTGFMVNPVATLKLVDGGQYYTSISLNGTYAGNGPRPLSIKGVATIISGATGKPALDLTGVYQASIFEDFTIQGLYGAQPSVGILFARESAGAGTGMTTFKNVGTTGHFSLTGLYMYGTESNHFYGCRINNWSGKSALYGTRTAGAYSITSDYQTLVASAASTTDNRFSDTWFGYYNLDASGVQKAVDADVSVITLESVSAWTFTSVSLEAFLVNVNTSNALIRMVYDTTQFDNISFTNPNFADVTNGSPVVMEFTNSQTANRINLTGVRLLTGIVKTTGTSSKLKDCIIEAGTLDLSATNCGVTGNSQMRVFSTATVAKELEGIMFISDPITNLTLTSPSNATGLVVSTDTGETFQFSRQDEWATEESDIEDLSVATECEVTYTGHPFATGDRVYFTGITQTGWTVLNGNTYVLTKTGTDTFTIPVDTSALAAYVPGTDPGKIGKFSITWDPGTIADGAISTKTSITCTNAALGYLVDAVAPVNLQGCQLSGYISSSSTVALVISNLTGGNKTIASGEWRVKTRKPKPY